MTSKSPNPRLFVAALAAAATIAVILVVGTTRSSAQPIFTVVEPTRRSPARPRRQDRKSTRLNSSHPH